ncbi:hypothetical protein 50L [Ranavirus ambystoma1]|uniref:Uncharacterized protein n=1 Tax=Ranavirus ambystoma1 TaxID=265294 RepID=A0A0U2K4Y8_9VIRU|nr:hypothetical protein 50L [Ambystoma tigrinum virus]ALN36850.1 hypothetical protein 51L [Ambystoma tigrinum virus]ALN36949.1 hypothetical protein 48L [Ambystoma tigrinum virus]ALN37152.1 hypothetical protein 49L [Ambystoma tigrinum virus]ALN37266.1 hypothetical protein 61L [Ambystoma tigrinum virus]
MRIFGAASLKRMRHLKIVSVDVGVRHLAYCVINGDGIERLRLYDAGSSLSGVKAGERILTDLLESEDGGGEWLSADILLIEAQHVRNVKAQLVAQTIRTWATIRGLKWVQVPAALKLDRFVDGHGVMKYKEYKKACVKVCRDTAAERWPSTPDSAWSECWDGVAKKDDMADCLLQAAAWMDKRK